MWGRDYYDAISTSRSCASGTAPKPDLSHLAKPFFSSWCSCSKAGHCSQALPLPISQEPSEAGCATSSISRDALDQDSWAISLLPCHHLYLSLYLQSSRQLSHPDKWVILMLSVYSLFNSTSKTLLYVSASLPIKILSYTHNKFQTEDEPSVQNQIIIKLERKKIKWFLNVLEWETIISEKNRRNY